LKAPHQQPRRAEQDAAVRPGGVLLQPHL
jgi:hypothetical protein